MHYCLLDRDSRSRTLFTLVSRCTRNAYTEW